MKCFALSVLALCAIAGNSVSAQSCSGKGNGYHVNPTDCKKYFYCINGVMTTYDCSTSKSGWAREFFCGTPEETKAIVNSPTIKSIQNPNKTWKIQCAAQGWFADSEVCNRYFRCYMQNGKIVHTVMDTTGICATSEFVNSCTRGGNSGGISSDPNVLCAYKLDGYYSVVNNCNKYYYCSNKKAYVYDCATANAGWAKEFFCSDAAGKTAIINSLTVRSVQFNSGLYKNQCTTEGWMSDSANCNLYFRCYQKNGVLSQTKIDITNMCETSEYVQNCSRAPGGEETAADLNVTTNPA